MTARIPTLLIPLLSGCAALALCALTVSAAPVWAQAPHKAPKPKMRPMGSIGGNHFQLQINGVAVGNFQEAGGLKSENEIAEYRGNGGNHPVKVPGRTKIGDITLKRGVIAGNGQLNAWLNTVRNKRQPKRQKITLVEYNSAGLPMATYKLVNASPTKWTGPNLNAKGNDTAIEELVLSAENIEIVPHK